MNQTIIPHDDHSAAAAYIRQLDLGADPFAADFSSNYFYGGGMRRTILEQALHYVRFSDYVVLLTGSTGSGTSTLMLELLNQLQPLMECCQLNAEFMLAPEHLLYPLSQHLGMAWAEPVQVADFLAELETRAHLQQEPEPLLLVVDQAHYLSLESLEILQALYSGANGAIRLVLAGEYQIEQLVQLAGFAAEQLKILELEALTQSETAEYLLGRLRAAGYAGTDPLSSDQLVVLQQQSGGNLAQINRLAPRLLQVDTDTERRGFSLGIPIAHIVAIIILTAALVLSYLYRGADDDTADTMVAVQPSGENADWSAGSATAPARVERALPSAPEDAAVPEIQLMSEVAAPSSTEAEPVKQEQAAVDEAADEVAVAEEPKPAKPAPAAKIATPAPAVVKTPIAKTPEVKTPVAKAPVAKTPAVKAPPPAKPAASTFTAAEQRLLQHAGGDYMLQLMGSVSEQRVKQFVQQYAGRIAVSYFETTLQGKPWFVAVSGPYPGRAEAVAAIGSLPQALQQEKPWARNVVSIQQDIRNRD